MIMVGIRMPLDRDLGQDARDIFKGTKRVEEDALKKRENLTSPSSKLRFDVSHKRSKIDRDRNKRDEVRLGFTCHESE
jgi:hypothetical protein